MPIVYLAPDPIIGTKFIPGGNSVAAAAQLFCYITRTSTKQTMYTTSTGTVAWANPIVLDSGGNLGGSNEVWIPTGLPARFILAPATDTDPPASPYWTLDDVSGINDTSVTATEWVSGPAPTFVSATQFTLVGDQTANFTVGRRVRSTNTAGTIYSTITASVFTSLTTVTVAGGALDSGLSAVYYGLLDPVNTSIDFYHINKAASNIVGTAATTNIWASDGDTVHVSGTVTVGGFSSAPYVGARKHVIADSAFALVHSSATLVLPGTSTILVASSDAFDVYQNTAAQAIVMNYSRLTGQPVNTVLRNYIDGLSISVTGQPSVTISPGIAADVNNLVMMELSTSISKLATNTAWAVGTGQPGLLDSGVFNTTTSPYNIFLMRSSSGVVDVGYSSSFSAPALPSGYTHYRRIGSADQTNVSSFLFQTGYGDTVLFNAKLQSAAGAFVTTSPASSYTLYDISSGNLPYGAPVEAIFHATLVRGSTFINCNMFDPAASTGGQGIGPFPPSISSYPLAMLSNYTSSAGMPVSGEFRVRTNASSQILVGFDAGALATTATFRADIIGWRDYRGRDGL